MPSERPVATETLGVWRAFLLVSGQVASWLLELAIVLAHLVQAFSLLVGVVGVLVLAFILVKLLLSVAPSVAASVSATLVAHPVGAAAAAILICGTVTAFVAAVRVASRRPLAGT